MQRNVTIQKRHDTVLHNKIIYQKSEQYNDCQFNLKLENLIVMIYNIRNLIEIDARFALNSLGLD